MKHKVLVKLILCYVVTAVSMFALLNLLGSKVIYRSMLRERTTLLQTEAESIAQEYVRPYYQSTTKLSDIQIQLRSVGNFFHSRIWFINTKGSIILDTGDTAKGMNIDSLDENFLDGALEDGYLEHVRLQNLFEEEMLAVIEPLRYNYKLKGYVCMFMPISDINLSVNRYLDFVNLCYLVLLAMLFIIFIIIYRNTIQPTVKMTQVTREYAKGHFDVPMKIKSKDEYRDLADAIKYMADEFQNLDVYQKQFLANISHDFRSPLTSIRGYAEAMSDGTIPYEMQKKYFDIILFETDRLTKLTNNLLELNSFDAKGIMLKMAVFDLNEVIRTTALSFEGTCTKKRITLELVFENDSLFVYADKEKIQQVLYNLIDNAIKFSNADASVEIRTKQKGNKAFAVVKDYGIGIPKDSLTHIWERFYKTDLSRGKDKKGTGLGLSIAKEIVQAHQENINVVSTEGVGTEFTFSLPLGE